MSYRITPRNDYFEALCNTPEGRISIPDVIEFSLGALGPGVYSASNRNNYQKQINKMFLGSRERQVCKADNLTAICELIA
jgi:hypothetical protein